MVGSLGEQPQVVLDGFLQLFKQIVSMGLAEMRRQGVVSRKKESADSHLCGVLPSAPPLRERRKLVALPRSDFAPCRQRVLLVCPVGSQSAFCFFSLSNGKLRLASDDSRIDWFVRVPGSCVSSARV